MLDERLDTDRSEDRAEAYVIVPFVGDGASKVACGTRAIFGPIRISLGHFVLQWRSMIASSAVSTRNVV